MLIGGFDEYLDQITHLVVELMVGRGAGHNILILCIDPDKKIFRVAEVADAGSFRRDQIDMPCIGHIVQKAVCRNFFPQRRGGGIGDPAR